MMIRSLIAAALLVAPQVAAAQAQPLPCLTSEEAGNMMLVFVPSFIEGAARKCGPSLGAGAFLRADYRAMVDRLRGETDRSWPSARLAMEKMTGTPMPEGVSDATARKLLEETVSHELVGELAAEDCAAVDSLVRSLSPLPTENFGAMVTALVQLTSDDEDADMPFRICSAGAR